MSLTSLFFLHSLGANKKCTETSHNRTYTHADSLKGSWWFSAPLDLSPLKVRIFPSSERLRERPWRSGPLGICNAWSKAYTALQCRLCVRVSITLRGRALELSTLKGAGHYCLVLYVWILHKDIRHWHLRWISIYFRDALMYRPIIGNKKKKTQ